MKAMQKEVSLRYSSATELLKDLSLALKNPEGEGIGISEENIENSYTQVIPTIREGEEMKKKETETKNKKCIF